MSYTSEETARLNAVADAISALAIGDGVTVSVYTDRQAYTVIKKGLNQMILQQDRATLDPSFKPEIIPVGFAGHCVNQSEQSYTYERDLNGQTVKITLRRWKDAEGNQRRMWKQLGVSVRERGGNVYLGRRAFHDYNF